MIDTLKTFQSNYKISDLKQLSISWIDKYLSWNNDDELCTYFEDVFNEKASLFEIEGNAKKVMEDLLISYYHNEAFIKAELIKELKKKKNSISFFELPINNSRIDLCSINGSSVAYEIKTKYDTTKRLEKQLNDYLTVFEYVYVVCSNDKTSNILKMIPDCVGVYEYDDELKKPKFILVKEATHSPYIDSKSQLYILRKSEIPNNIDKYNEEETNGLFKKCLKDRYRNKWQKFCKHYKEISILDYQYAFKNF